MALVTVQRSPSVVNSPHCSLSDIETDENEDGNCETECFFAGKGTACLILPIKEKLPNTMDRRHSTDSNKSTTSNLSSSSDIQQHLQQMFLLLRREETLKMAVKLESQRPNRTRYLAVVSHTHIQNNGSRKSRIKKDSDRLCMNDKDISLQLSDSDISKENKLDEFNERNTHKKKPSLDFKDVEESCLLGIDCNEKTTIGLVLPLLADTSIHLDGDGGFSVSVFGKTHIFKPVSVQAMWSALQSLHKVSHKARDNNLYPGGPSHEWVSYYHSKIDSERSCLNEWNTMDSIESRRPPSPDAIRNKPTEKEEAEKVIRMKLREIMMSVDLDEVTSKYIRSRLEELLDMDLGEYKSFIDEEMLTILGQMDAPTKIFEHVYLGSEWNASNLEELQKNGVRHILNVTREIDNFFPGLFDYYNVRVYDDEKTNLLKYWDNTFRYISSAKSKDSKVLVHCKMGVSRSASVVIAYAMKAYNWDFKQAIQHVKERRNCIKPNKNFLAQLETYRGMLDAMKNKEKLQRSKSETNLKSVKDARLLPGSEPTPLIQALNQAKQTLAKQKESHRKFIRRSSSSSPKNVQNAIIIKQQSQSLENLTPTDRRTSNEEQQKNIRHTDINGQNYSITQNQVLHIQKNFVATQQQLSVKASVKTIINDLENSNNYNMTEQKSKTDRKSLNLFLSKDNNSEIVEKEHEFNRDESPLPVWTSSTKLVQQSTEPHCSSIILNLDNKETLKKDDQTKNLDTDEDDNNFDKKKLSYVQIWQANNTNNKMEPNFTSRKSSSISTSLENYEKFDKITSRHSSSWGPIDSVTRILPSRNSSLGSYDTNYRKNFRFSNPTPPKSNIFKSDSFGKEKNSYSLERNLIRTKPKNDAFNMLGIKESSIINHDKFNRIPQRCNSEEIILGLHSRNHQPLSASAPDAYSASTLPKIYDKFAISSSSYTTTNIFIKSDSDKHDSNSAKKFPTNVQNLKRNFEAKVLPKDQKKKGNSLPTSPSSTDASAAAAAAASAIVDDIKTNHEQTSQKTATDLSVKGLVIKYQSGGSGGGVNVNISTTRPTTRPRSFYDNRSTKSDMHDTNKRLPPVPPIFNSNNNKNTLTNHSTMTDSILKQNFSCSNYRKMQHGKTHPLARLNTISKQRFNTSAYNTM